MNDKQEFDASDIVWDNIKFDDPWASHVVIYHNPDPPQRFQKLNPFAWIKYWKLKSNNLIAYADLNGSDEGHNATYEVQEDGTIHIFWELPIE